MLILKCTAGWVGVRVVRWLQLLCLHLIIFIEVLTCVPDDLAEIKAEIEWEGTVVWGLGFVSVKYRLEKHHKFRSQPLY